MEQAHDSSQQLLLNLDNNLFVVQKDRPGGCKTYLNVNSLWDLFWYVRLYELSMAEQNCIVDYQLQVFLIELVQSKENFSSVSRVLERITEEIRSDPGYWVEYSEVHLEIVQKQKQKEEGPPAEATKNAVAIPVKSGRAQEKENKENKKGGKKQADVAQTQSIVDASKKKRGRKSNADKQRMLEEAKVKEGFSRMAGEPTDEQIKIADKEEYEHEVVVKTSKLELTKLNPIEAISNYQKYIDIASKQFPKSSLADFNKTEIALYEARRVLIPSSEQSMGEINLVTQSFLKEAKKQHHIVRSENRYTRNMRKTVKSDDYSKLRAEFENTPESLGKRLRLDIMDCLPLNYGERILFNPRYFPYTKLKINILPIVFNFLLKLTKLDLEEHHHFRLVLQNFLFYLNHSSSPIEIYGADPKICKGISIDELVQQAKIKHTKALFKFFEYCKHKSLNVEDTLERVQSTRMVQLTFLSNLLRLGRMYIEIYKTDAQNLPRLHRTYGTLDKALNRKLPMLRGSDKMKYLNKLETLTELSASTIKDLVLFFISRNDAKMTSSTKEVIHQYSSLIERRTKFLKTASSSEREQLGTTEHSNCYQDQEWELAAINRYADYIEHPETKQKQSYKFYGEEEFKLPLSGYKTFVESFARLCKKQVINAKIAAEVGHNASPSQIKHLKQRYMKDLVKRASKAGFSMQEQLELDAKQFDLNKLFPWITDKNIAKEDAK